MPHPDRRNGQSFKAHRPRWGRRTHRRAQDRGSRPRIALQFLRTRLRRLGHIHPAALGRLRHRHVPRLRGSALVGIEEPLDDPVLKRVERHHRQPSAFRQYALGREEPVHQLIEFRVDRDPQRLEAARRRMHVPGLRPIAFSISRANCVVVVIGSFARAATMNCAIRRDLRSSP